MNSDSKYSYFPGPIYSNETIEYREVYKTREEEVLAKTANKTEKSVENLPQFVEIGRGAIKIVWVKRSKIKPSEEAGKKPSIHSQSVYYTAMSSLFKGATRELQSEFEKMSTIAHKLKEVEEGSTAHLAVEGKEMKDTKRINADYTLKVERASTDFEKKLLKEMSFRERIRFGSHFLNGLSNLHRVNYTHGDLKPENLLIYEKEQQSSLKLADFGKAKELNGDDTTIYSGNLRYAPPEGMQSKKGDVFGAALILIRDFEEGFLTTDNPSLIDIKSEDMDMQASPNLRGVEKFVVENKAFLACNEGFNFNVISRRLRMPLLSQSNQKKQVDEIHQYIDTLQGHLVQQNHLQPSQIEAFCNLLKNMTDVDPNTRLSTEEAEKQYNEIFQENL